MKYNFDQDLHIHSQLSACSCDQEQSTENILKYAIANNLKTICLADHFWDERVDNPSVWYSTQNFAHISKALPFLNT